MPCIQKPTKENNKSGLLQRVVFKCRMYEVDSRRGVVSEQWSLKAADCSLSKTTNFRLFQTKRVCRRQF